MDDVRFFEYMFSRDHGYAQGRTVGIVIPGKRYLACDCDDGYIVPYFSSDFEHQHTSSKWLNISQEKALCMMPPACVLELTAILADRGDSNENQ